MVVVMVAPAPAVRRRAAYSARCMSTGARTAAGTTQRRDRARGNPRAEAARSAQGMRRELWASGGDGAEMDLRGQMLREAQLSGTVAERASAVIAWLSAEPSDG